MHQANNVVSYIVVVGGGGGGSDLQLQGGGGGAGGFRESKVVAVYSTPLDGNPGGTSITVTVQLFQ